MFELTTERLQIIPLPLHLLKKCRRGRGCMEKALGLQVTDIFRTDDPPEIKDALEEMIQMVSDDKKNWKWHTNWEIIYKKENRIIGGTAFYGSPDISGICETAYIIQEEYRRQGFAYEALSETVKWALLNGAKTVKAEVEKKNEASRRLLLKLKFIKSEETEFTDIFTCKIL